jgi:hypothetical protein
MQNSFTSGINSESTRQNLSYINDLVIEATSIGMYYIMVDGRYMGEDEKINLLSYGYNVTESTNDFGTFITYKIQWEGEGFLQNEIFSFLTDENGDYLIKDQI